jgi:uncharacterized protein YbjT (DUF2867 family)
MKIVVIGGTGLIGSKTVAILQARPKLPVSFRSPDDTSTITPISWTS